MRQDADKSFTVNVNGEPTEHTYLFTQMVPEEATRVAIRLMKIAGLQVGGAIGSLQISPKGIQGQEEMNVDMDILGQSIGKMFQEINEDETVDTFKKLLNSVLYNGKPMKINHPNFQGQTLHLLNVLMEAGRVNFSDFFDASSGVVETLKKVVNMTLAKATSTGPTGDSSSQE